MADEERRRRRRGRRRGRGGGRPQEGPAEEQRGAEPPPEATGEGEVPEEVQEERGSRFRFGLRRGGEDAEKSGERHERREEGAGHRPGASPLGFWRRGRSRAYREQPMPQQTLSRTLRRIRGMYFPPWVPVAFIIVVVFGILGAMFVVRSAGGKPRIGQDHWHATYSVFICGQRQPNFPTWEAGVHTHADGVIHIHPFVPSEEGAGARLVKWFEYGGGKLTQSEMRKPGDRTEYKNGDKCPDGSEATLQVFVNGEKMDNWSRYIPKDGDRVRIVFGPSEGEPVELDDRTVIAESEATSTVEVEITGGEADAAFAPNTIDIAAGATLKVVFKNSGSISHSVRAPGPDGEYDTVDDFVATTQQSDIITPGEEGVMVVRFDAEGEYEFSDPTSPVAVGRFVAGAEAPPDVTPTPGEGDGGDEEPVDVELGVSMRDNFYEPNALEVEAGQSFRLNLSNDGNFVHNLRIAGDDGAYDTGDDLTSDPDVQQAGEDGELVGQLDTPGTYTFRCDFHPAEMTGTITVK